MVKSCYRILIFNNTAPIPFWSCPKADKDGGYKSQKNNRL